VAEFLAPDVYVEEVQGQSAQIGAPSTSTFAIVGYSPRGPEGKAFIHGSFKEFVDRFGGFSTKSLNAYTAAAFYQNGGSRLVFVRQLADDATAATGAFPSTWSVQASGRGVWANDSEITISGNPNFYDVETATYSKFDVQVQVIDPSTGVLATVENFEALELVDDEDPDYITKVIEASSEYISVADIGGGIPAELQPVPHAGEALGTGNAVLTTFSQTYSLLDPLAAGAVKIKVDGIQVAEDDGAGNISGTGITGSVDYDTGAVSVTFVTPPALSAAITADVITAPDASVTVTLLGGADGSTIVLSDLTAISLKPLKKGIYALDELDEQLQLALPDFAGDTQAIKDLITYAESRKDVLVICEPPKGSTAQAAANFKRNVVKSVSSYAAMYYPWVSVPDPLNRNRPKTVPPCGHVAGRMAYTDQNENVGKAPAGVIRGQLAFISGVERVLTKAEQGVVYQAQVNPIRSDANVGTSIFGNKTLQVVGDFTEVNVRRLFIFLEKAQYVGLLDVLFENIGPVTFALIKTRLDTFLENLFLQGVIGSGVPSKDQAFKVVCDETNNPASVQQQRRIVIDEFIKPNIAAEFIHLRLQRVFDASEV
jgi:phage tail sheath protein FI